MDNLLKEFQVDSNGDQELFWQKLTTENAWSLAFSKNAFNEYLKFIHLAKKYGCRVVPSKIVDKVWHLHMTFTKSYWNELCQDVLQMEFHHVPTSPSKAAEQLDNQCYEETIALYKKEFGYAPPSLYWPQLHKSKFNKFNISFISIFCVTLLSACTSALFSDVELILKWVIGVYVVYKVLSWLGKGGTGGGSGCGSSGSNCSSSSCGSSCGGGD